MCMASGPMSAEVALPEWVSVWRWYRLAFPDDRRPFPQQGLPGDSVEFERARGLWLAATGASASAPLRDILDELLAGDG